MTSVDGLEGDGVVDADVRSLCPCDAASGCLGVGGFVTDGTRGDGGGRRDWGCGGRGGGVDGGCTVSAWARLAAKKAGRAFSAAASVRAEDGG